MAQRWRISLQHRSSGLGRSSREGNGHPLQYSCQDNPMDRGAWKATVCGVTESDTTEWLILTLSHYSTFLRSGYLKINRKVKQKQTNKKTGLSVYRKGYKEGWSTLGEYRKTWPLSPGWFMTLNWLWRASFLSYFLLSFLSLVDRFDWNLFLFTPLFFKIKVNWRIVGLQWCVNY